MSPDKARVELPLLGAEDAFLDAIFASPSADGPRRMYADWLEERGDARGEFLRLDCELAGLPPGGVRREPLEARLGELRPSLDHAWLVAVERAAVGNCPPRLAFECPRRWDLLVPTGN